MGGLDYIDSLLADCFFTRIWMYLISKGPKPQLALEERDPGLFLLGIDGRVGWIWYKKVQSHHRHWKRVTWDDFFLGLMGKLDGSGIKRSKTTTGIGRE